VMLLVITPTTAEMMNLGCWRIMTGY